MTKMTKMGLTEWVLPHFQKVIPLQSDIHRFAFLNFNEGRKVLSSWTFSDYRHGVWAFDVLMLLDFSNPL